MECSKWRGLRIERGEINVYFLCRSAAIVSVSRAKEQNELWRAGWRAVATEIHFWLQKLNKWTSTTAGSGLVVAELNEQEFVVLSRSIIIIIAIDVLVHLQPGRS